MPITHSNSDPPQEEPSKQQLFQMVKSSLTELQSSGCTSSTYEREMAPEVGALIVESLAKDPKIGDANIR